MCHETLGFQINELTKWWEKVHDIFKKALQQVLQQIRVGEQFYQHQL